MLLLVKRDVTGCLERLPHFCGGEVIDPVLFQLLHELMEAVVGKLLQRVQGAVAQRHGLWIGAFTSSGNVPLSSLPQSAQHTSIASCAVTRISTEASATRVSTVRAVLQHCPYRGNLSKLMAYAE